MGLVGAIERLVAQEDGADATEYALLVSLIAIVIIVSVRALGTTLNTFYNNVQANVP